MWGRYGKGVVVFSRFDLLKAQLNRLLDDILLGTVKYTKRACFEKEKEIRIVLECLDPLAGMNRHYNRDNFQGANRSLKILCTNGFILANADGSMSRIWSLNSGCRHGPLRRSKTT
jgi:hypothetical protein